MDTLCTAGSKLILQEEDLATHGDKLSPDATRALLLFRSVDLRLDFPVALSNKVEPLAPWRKASWEGGTSDLCGSCSVCSILQQGLYRRLEPQVSAWIHKRKTASSSETSLAQAKVRLNRLEHLTDPGKWVMSEKVAIKRGLFLIVLHGTAIIEVAGVALETINVAVPFEVSAEEHDPLGKHLNIYRRPLDEQSLSHENVEKIKGWLKECDEGHEKCQVDVSYADNLTVAPMPTRLLDVGGLNRHPKLVLTSEIQQLEALGHYDTRYMALSYCWGSPEDSSSLLTTTSESLSSRLQSIPTDILPRAFRDAVTIARVLQIPYIWIDSLCIIQGDIRDWQTESSKMADIFSNAYLTIIAAAGASCHDSFLFRDSSPIRCTIPFKSVRYLGVEGYYHLRHRPGTKWWGSDKMAGISGRRWLGRGWTFQEERLARRVLMFGVDKFFFDCKSFEMTEDTIMRGRRPDWTKILNDASKSEEQEITSERIETSLRYQRAVLTQWWTLCNHYSRRELSFDDDKLPAISGMASKIAKNIESEYLAGMWKNHLEHDLFWQTREVARHPVKYRAPSWSWAAVDAEVQWQSNTICRDDQCRMYCNIEKAQVEIAGLDPFGAVRVGCLKISGAVLEVELLWALDGRSEKHPWRVCIDGSEIARADLDMEKRKPLLETEKNRSWALLVAKCAGRTSPPRGLILRKTGSQRDGLEEFQREGIFRIFPHIWPDTSNNTRHWEDSQRQSIVLI